MDKPENNSNVQDLNNISIAQTDLGKGYADGSLGILTSGAVWLVAALVAFFVSSQTAVWTLFFGGMFIHPLSLLIGKLMGVPGKHSKQNPLGKLAVEGTVFMVDVHSFGLAALARGACVVFSRHVVDHRWQVPDLCHALWR